MEQLQQTLNKCIEMGWKPRGKKYEKTEIKFHLNSVLGKVAFISGKDGHLFGPHEIFSKESGLMEFVKWKHQIEGVISVNPECSYHSGMDCDDSRSITKSDYHYIKMSDMTAQEKIQYFNENAAPPQI